MKNLISALWLCISIGASAQPFTVAPDLFDRHQPETLGLATAPGTESITVYRGVSEESQYNHGAVLFANKGTLYLQWQSSQRDEDAVDTRVLYASSSDGLHWSAPKVLAPAREGAVVTSGGWWAQGDELYAFINVWPNNLAPRGGYTEVFTRQNGEHWGEAARPKFASGEPLDGVIEQDFHTYCGRLVTALHRQPGLQVAPLYTDDPSGLSGWKLGQFENLSVKDGVSRELEPSNFMRRDGTLVMVFRDQQSSFRVLAAASKDCGETWSRAQATNMPDSRAKQSAGNLPDGTAYIVNNPSGSKTREPLTVTLSDDGATFDRAYLLRAGGEQLEGPRYEGLYKRKGFSYPKSFVWREHLYVAYGENKENIVVTRVPLASLAAH
ncbi:exo-alpha-sialidase [Microbulbifer sp. CAU 1566]|uniref:sialidase family protein n=1 Tax=Microbulbifer sp. CAU 1566 TaxID=2933269 RepID=UPI00200593F6|nr:sialidase family protein [Microbulbifer sp. CAU 1566]MCK7596309.1 exo-alpha-sialidase [Microbulbifer sp. CAU 1566]